MSYPQIQSTSDYLGALQDADYRQAQPSLDDNQGAKLDGPEYLNFMNFEAAGSAVTYDSNSFAPDSASTATSIATGYKTYSGSINVDETGSKKYETIAEKLKEQKGWEIGVISSVNLNHATPAAFYAHQASRSSYYEIGLELVESGFDYFAGGGLLKPTGSSGDQTDLYELAQEAGYTVAKTHAEADAIGTNTEKAIIIDEDLADSDAMAYELDRTDDMWALADYVAKGIEVLDNDTGFFMMCEGGKIDWACHANDAASSIHDTQALADAVQVAIDFAKEHADETLILVTGDHETGGLTIGFAGTDYDTYLDLLENQKISFAKYDSDYVASYKANKTPFETVLADIEKLFGLKAQGEEGDKLVLTAYEMEQLRAAYERASTVPPPVSTTKRSMCSTAPTSPSLSPSPTSSTTSPASPSPLTATPVCPWQSWPRAQAARCSTPPHRAFGSLNARSACGQTRPSPPPLTNNLFLQHSRQEPHPLPQTRRNVAACSGPSPSRIPSANRSISHIGKGTTRLRRPIGPSTFARYWPILAADRQRLIITLS